MGFKANQIFVNLPIKNLIKSVDFFTKLGFEFNAQFTNESTTCMIIGENMFAMLLEEADFKTFIKKEISDAIETTEVIVALSVDSREMVDEIVNKAIAAGGKPSNDPFDHGFMYGWSFQDLDSHLWEIFYMDPSAGEQG
jgi:predicted lactoylglutathione lyase